MCFGSSMRKSHYKYSFLSVIHTVMKYTMLMMFEELHYSIRQGQHSASISNNFTPLIKQCRFRSADYQIAISVIRWKRFLKIAKRMVIPFT